MEIPTGCLPREFWCGMFNLTEDELNGQACAKLGVQGIIRLEPCKCKEIPIAIVPWEPFRVL